VAFSRLYFDDVQLNADSSNDSNTASSTTQLPPVQLSAPTPIVVSGTTTPPSINIQGSNPAIIKVGDTYACLAKRTAKNAAR
jgi:hypothetical protein